MITMIDDAVGRTLGCLKELGLDRDAIVVFTSDHGDYMGDHGLMLKLLLHYQGLIRTPLIWQDIEGRPPRVDDTLASTLDLAPTILRRCGIQSFNGMQGRNLFDDNEPPPAGLIVEEDSQRNMVGFNGPQRVRTYVTRDWRLSMRLGEDWGELYDLRNDPHENVNLWSDPGYAAIRGELFEAAMQRIVALQDRSPFPTARA